jgi:hypothetical protein
VGSTIFIDPSSRRSDACSLGDCVDFRRRCSVDPDDSSRNGGLGMARHLHVKMTIARLGYLKHKIAARPGLCRHVQAITYSTVHLKPRFVKSFACNIEFFEEGVAALELLSELPGATNVRFATKSTWNEYRAKSGEQQCLIFSDKGLRTPANLLPNFQNLRRFGVNPIVTVLGSSGWPALSNSDTWPGRGFRCCDIHVQDRPMLLKIPSSFQNLTS